MPPMRYPNGPVQLVGFMPAQQSGGAPVNAHVRIGIGFQVVTYSNGQYEHRLQRPPHKQDLEQTHTKIIARGRAYLIPQDDIGREASRLLSLLPSSKTKRDAPAVRELFKGLDQRVVKVIIEYLAKTSVNTATHTSEGEDYNLDLQFETIQTAEELEICGLSRLMSLEIKATQKSGLFSVEYISKMLGMPGDFNSFLRKWSFAVIEDEEKDEDRKTVIGLAVAELPEYHNLLSSYSGAASDTGMKLDGTYLPPMSTCIEANGLSLVTKNLLSTSIPEDNDVDNEADNEADKDADNDGNNDASNEAWTDTPADDLADIEAEAPFLDDQEDADQGEASQSESDDALPASPTPTPAPKRLKLNTPKPESVVASAASEAPVEENPEPAKLVTANGKTAKGEEVKGKVGKNKAAKGEAGKQKVSKQPVASKKRKAPEPAEPASPAVTRSKTAKKA